MAAYRVVAGYVSVETAVPGGRAVIDIPAGSMLPDDVPGETADRLLAAGDIEPVEPQWPVVQPMEEPAEVEVVAPPTPQKGRRRPRKPVDQGSELP